MNEKPITYTTIGNVRGACGHTHRSILAAWRCQDRDYRECKRAGSAFYTDRRIVRTDGEEMTDAEIDLCYALDLEESCR